MGIVSSSLGYDIVARVFDGFSVYVFAVEEVRECVQP